MRAAYGGHETIEGRWRIAFRVRFHDRPYHATHVGRVDRSQEITAWSRIEQHEAVNDCGTVERELKADQGAARMSAHMRSSHPELTEQRATMTRVV